MQTHMYLLTYYKWTAISYTSSN